MNNLEKIVYEKSSNIKIPAKNNQEKNQYSLNQDVFDPFRCSPPNHFMTKLKTRMSNYTSLVINEHIRNSE
jgi:hypothetical protein